MYFCDVLSGKKDIIKEILFDINLINTKGTQKNHHLVCEIYVNFEVPIKGKKDSGRIDFLIKKDLGDKWKLIEVKLRDNPNAVNQLCNYIEMINLNVKKNKR